mgnify:CR=1 FL=1
MRAKTFSFISDDSNLKNAIPPKPKKGLDEEPKSNDPTPAKPLQHRPPQKQAGRRVIEPGHDR